ncbi:MAG: efflux RND transporter periplasmic adaptor subunit [Terracidiphilus sp.]
MAERKTQASRFWLWMGALALIVIVFFTAHYFLRERLPVREAQVTYQDLEKTVSTNGRVEAEKPYQFYSPISTTVQAVYVQEGDRVPAGKLLIVLDDTAARAQVAASESAVKTAQAGLYDVTHNGTQEQQQMAKADVARSRIARNQAQRNLEALTKLETTGAASASEVAAAREQLATARASLEAAEQNAGSRYSPVEETQARAALTDAEANFAAAQKGLAQTRIVAPIAGTIYSLDARPTQFEQAGSMVLEMANLSEERVRAYFDEPEIGGLTVGQKVVINWDAKPGLAWQGHIERTPITVVAYGTRMVGEALIHIDTADSGLLPNTNVNVSVTTANMPHVLTVPREAVYPQNGHPGVFRIVDGKLVHTPVTTGAFNLTQEAILSGLREGEWVATGSPTGQPLQDEMDIKVVQ